MIGDFILCLVLLYAYFIWLPRIRSRFDWLGATTFGLRPLIAGEDLEALREAICATIADNERAAAAEVQQALAAKERAEAIAGGLALHLSEALEKIEGLQEEVRSAKAPRTSRDVVLEVRRQVRQRLHPDKFGPDKQPSVELAFKEAEVVFRELLR